ncbi:hypothetical protein K458DRAFT_390149 [Lentithecium fluviatile CBS 122367]|uniref:Uncharacterized protein n=1 Tax=Lentithecium fluviatile CBS 122367 TaxID=1168545 RepID=A0A6G1IZ55_9PLEO|nr:hypothetical protein K458DRAFT_390149 [Lentithecium fluviatile CBS 122367]
MGRQAFLTKIALGRSAFEPSQTATQTSEYIQLASSQQEVPPEARDPDTNQYIQLYDERGNPINPRAHEHGRRLREAQNDVLASIGVVARLRSPSQDLPGSYEQRLQQLDDEDTAGNAIALASTLSENICTWWIGSLRERIYTFRFGDALPFSRIVTSECALSGKSIVNSGFTARLLHTLGIQAVVYAAFVLKPLDQLLLTTRTSQGTKQSYRRLRNVTKTILRISLEFLFYPLAYHSYLQRLGLIPARPLLPPAKTFVPFSAYSPLLPFSLYYDASASILHFTKAALTSPFVLVCLEHLYERWVYSAVNEAIETAVIQPTNPDIPSPDDGSKARKTAILGLRKRSPQLARMAIGKLLAFVGWGETDAKPHEVNQRPTTQSLQRQDFGEGQTIEVGNNQVTNLNRLGVPFANQDAPVAPESRENADVAIPTISLSDALLPATPPSLPPSPTASQTSRDENDPRIRITSREGIVEMEVRLPPHILSSRSELAQSGPITSHRDIDPSTPGRTVEMLPFHRVTQLSTEPAQMIGAIVKAQLVSWVTLPLKIVTLRLIASHYLAGRHGYVGSRRVLQPFPTTSDLDWPSIGVQVSRIALCGALELVIDLCLWGVQYLAVAYTGANTFSWGTL